MVLNGVLFPEDRIRELCRQAGVRRLYLFGSILSDGFTSASDVDMLVETDPGQPAGLLKLGGLQMDLSDLLGRRVHFTLIGGIPSKDRAAVLSGAQRLVAA